MIIAVVGGSTASSVFERWGGFGALRESAHRAHGHGTPVASLDDGV
jgi:hypothetical protein